MMWTFLIFWIISGLVWVRETFQRDRDRKKDSRKCVLIRVLGNFIFGFLFVLFLVVYVFIGIIYLDPKKHRINQS